MSEPTAGEPITSSFITDRLADGDRIDVRSNQSTLITSIDDAAVVRGLCVVIDRLAEPWGNPVDGVPVARRRFDVSQGSTFLGSVGVARAFLVAHVAGGFVSYDLDDGGATERALLDLVGLGRAGTA